MIALGPASALSLDCLAELFDDAYEGYVVPFRLSEPALRFMVDAFDYDLDASLVARADGQPVGLAMLGLRGSSAWCGGLGVVAAGRGTGLGERLMRALLDSARERGAERMQLEVIDRNEAARALYAKLGFEHVRELEVWTLGAQAQATAARAPADEAHAWIRARRTWSEPWQRTDETLARLHAIEPAPEGVLVDGGAAVVRVAGPRVSLLQAAAEDAAAGEHLLRAAVARGESLHALNLPADDPLAASLHALGARVDLRQYELALRL